MDQYTYNKDLKKKFYWSFDVTVVIEHTNKSQYDYAEKKYSEVAEI